MILKVKVSDEYPTNKENSFCLDIPICRKVVRKKIFLRQEDVFFFMEPFVWIDQDGESFSDIRSNCEWKLLKD